MICPRCPDAGPLVTTRGATPWCSACEWDLDRFEPDRRGDEVSLFASHPPTGLRARLLEHRPAHPAAVVLPEQQSARIDHETAGPAEAVRRELAAAC